MAGSGSDRAAMAPAQPRRAQTWLFSLALAALVLGTVAGVAIARNRAVDAVEDRARRAAASAAALLEIEVRQVAAGLGGAAAVVGPDGELDVEVFRAFAGDPLSGEELRELALIGIVLEDERAEFEARTGRPISVLDDRGLVTAPPAPVHHPVLSVQPDLGDGAAIGFDFGSDRARRAVLEAAQRTRAAVVGDVTEVAGGLGPVVPVVRPLLDGDDVVRGFVATGIPLDQLEATIDTASVSGASVALLDGDTLIAGDALRHPDEATAAPVDVPSGSWRVLVGPGPGPDVTVAWLVAGGGAVAILAMTALVFVTERHQRRLARTNALLATNEERSRAVQVVAGRLARALGGSDVAAALVDHLPAAVGARSAVVATMDSAGRLGIIEREPDGGELDDGELEGDRGTTEVRRLPVPVAGSVVESALAQREPAWLSSPLGWKGDDVATVLASDGQALAVLPLLADDVTGVLAVSYPRFHIFGDDEQELLQTVGVLAARALARGRRYDAEHETAVAFQRTALPDALPAVDGATIAARYRPATHGATVGGDWYDALLLDDDHVLLVVGDVVGHGMVAAAAMGRLRTAFQTIVRFTADPGLILQAINQQVLSIPDAFCTTVVCVVLHLGTGELVWSRAGHPPPLVLGAGERSLLDAPCLPPLGVADDAVAPVHHRALAPGDVVVLYTDGLVERRTEALDQGFRRLGAVAAQLTDLDPEELSDALVEALVPAEEQTDDLAVLVVRWDGRGSGGG